MAGTMSRAERPFHHLLVLVGAAFALSTATPARAAAVPDAMVLRLEAADLSAMAEGLRERFFDGPIEGRTDERFEQDYWLSAFGVEGLSYRFEIERIHLTPRQGRLHAEIQLQNLEINVERVFFNSSGSLFCRNMPLSSAGATIPVSADLEPRATDRTLAVDASNVRVGLWRGNYQPGEPAECRTFWGFNWLLRRVMPLAAQLLRPALELKIERRLEAAARDAASALGDVLTAEITLPFDRDPVPSFNATVGLWPSSVSITPAHVQLAFGADVEISRSPPPKARPADDARLARLTHLLPSYLGVSRRLLEATLREANAQGLFHARIGGASMPEPSDLLVAASLAPFLPDAATRFRREDRVALAMSGARNISVVVLPCGPGGIPIIDVVVDDLAVGIEVESRPYYDMRLGMRLSFAAGVRTSDQKLVFGIEHVTTEFRSGAFAPGLAPAPADARFLAEPFDDFMGRIDERLSAGAGRILEVTMPEVAFGSRRLAFIGSSAREDYVTLDARVLVP